MTIKWDVEDVLEQSLSQIAAGKARVESSLLAYPAVADELKPLLLAAEMLRAIPKPVPSPEAKARMEAQVLGVATTSRVRRPARQSRQRVAAPGWGWAFSTLAAVFVCVVLTMTTVVTASAQALPGSGLYPVKLATEDAWLRLAPERREPSLHLRFAQRRLTEVEELAERGRFEPLVLEATVAQVEAALTQVEKLPPDQALPLLAKAEAIIENEQQVLSGLQASLPPAAQPDLARTLGAMGALAGRVGEIRRLVSSSEPVVSPSPTSTVEASGTVTATATLLSSPTYTPSPTQTAAPASTGIPTSTTQPTAPPAVQPTPQPPTDTPPPPPPTDTPPPQPTKRTPPGQTHTPEPPGQTKTPKP